jgi:putative N-acetylmannosamine-6-phosphate epimerase
MSRIESFKRALDEKRAVKIIAGIDNFDVENVKKVVIAASNSGASAVDICADPDIIAMVRNLTDLPVFVSSVDPEELAHAVALGADAVELGNFDALYKNGMSFSAEQVLNLAKRTKELVGDTFLCVTIPGELEIGEQVELARALEELGIDLIQTEGHFSNESPSNGVRGLIERAELTISNTIELSRNIELPIMTATGINPTTASLAFAAGASAIGCGSCVNKLDSEIAMLAVSRSLVEIADRSAQYSLELV